MNTLLFRPTVRILRRVSTIPLETVEAIHNKFSLSQASLKPAVASAVCFSNWPISDKEDKKMAFSICVRILFLMLIFLATVGVYIAPRFQREVSVNATVCGKFAGEFALREISWQNSQGKTANLVECIDLPWNMEEKLGCNK